MTDEVSQRERAINLCQELAIPENEQVLNVIVYALNKWTNPPQESLVTALKLALHNLMKVGIDETRSAEMSISCRLCHGYSHFEKPANVILDHKKGCPILEIEAVIEQADLREFTTVEEVAATAYQILGVMDAPVRVLDYFSAIGNGERPENILPFSPDELRDASPRTQESADPLANIVCRTIDEQDAELRKSEVTRQPSLQDVFPDETDAKLAREIHERFCEGIDESCTDETEWIAQKLAEHKLKGGQPEPAKETGQ